MSRCVFSTPLRLCCISLDEEKIITAFHIVFTHSEGNNTSIKMQFDFSSAFNTMSPMKVIATLTLWAKAPHTELPDKQTKERGGTLIMTLAFNDYEAEIIELQRC